MAGKGREGRNERGVEGLSEGQRGWGERLSEGRECGEGEMQEKERKEGK